MAKMKHQDGYAPSTEETKKMQPGNKVWVFQSGTQEIREEAALNVLEYTGGAVWISTMSECGILNRDVFPTREALCEHYRKIFE